LTIAFDLGGFIIEFEIGLSYGLILFRFTGLIIAKVIGLSVVIFLGLILGWMIVAKGIKVMTLKLRCFGLFVLLI
jgi:hypothetical protein